MKQIFTLSIFLLATLLSFAQSKGKDKTKVKQQTEIKSDVPPPAGHTKRPEVNTKQKPQIYQKTENNIPPIGNNQDESTKEKGKQKDKLKNNQSGNGNSKNSINIPTQVRNSFNADYPNAVNTVWTKNRGDWTVTFRNNIWNSTATYHSNGERVDTRTRVRKDQTPRPVQDEIYKRFPQTNPKDIFKIEKPKNPNLFQVVVEQAGKKKTLVFDEKGKLISQQ